MKFLALFVSILISISVSAQDGLENPITKAMMKVYQQQLDEDPHDYETYFKRANEYYNHDYYPKALSDINNALKYIPASEVDMKFQSLCMRASIYEMTNNYDKALADLNEAYSIDPTSYSVIYRKANAEYSLKQYDNAKADYQRMLNINPRSIEAHIGLSRIAVIEKNLGQANEYADNAVALSPSDPEVYIRRASVRKMMGNNTGAVDDLILALSTGKDNPKVLHELVEMGNADYSAVITGLSNAIRQAPKVGMYYYIRGIIAEAHFNYVSALDDFKKIANENLYNYHGIYKEIASCQYALGEYEEAIYNINYAINTSDENSEYYVIKANILRALGRSAEGLESCDKALSKDPNSTKAIVAKGLCLSDLCDYEQAIILFGEATLNESNNPYYFILRAQLLEKHLNLKQEAFSIYERVSDMEYDIYDVKSLKGFAQLANNKKDEAINWIENILANSTDNDGLINYYATCLFAQAGEKEKAFKCMKSSLQKGYANYFQWAFDSDAIVNVAPIRNDTQFKNLLEQYAIIFK